MDAPLTGAKSHERLFHHAKLAFLVFLEKNPITHLLGQTATFYRW
jgi:hypothetical protein